MAHHDHPERIAGAQGALNRRDWLIRSGAGLAGALGVGGMANLLALPKAAHAADYKAMVCIFLIGGNDGMNTIVPTEAALHNQYKGVRADIHIPVADLVPLSGVNYGLHPALSALSGAWNSGRLAPVFNVGPLVKPMTKAQFRAESVTSELVPELLFSHSDQVNLWANGTSKSLTRTGWGGRTSTLLGASPVISLAGSCRFGQSESQVPLALPEAPGTFFGAEALQPGDLGNAANAARRKALSAMYDAGSPLKLGAAYAKSQAQFFDVAGRLGDLVRVKPGDDAAMQAIDNAFAGVTGADRQLTTPIARQLYQIAKLVYRNATVGSSRQLFYAESANFDTHGDQLVNQNRLLKEVGDAMGAFYNAMVAVGLSDAVTAFTQSDFGRTFLPNKSAGTDHGWGNHHLVVGGGVRGGATFGTYPEMVIGSKDDVGVFDWELNGRWLPTTSVEQYAGTLLSWFGLTDAQQLSVLPNLKNFDKRNLGFI